jgi:hypothetical protein
MVDHNSRRNSCINQPKSISSNFLGPSTRFRSTLPWARAHTAHHIVQINFRTPRRTKSGRCAGLSGRRVDNGFQSLAKPCPHRDILETCLIALGRMGLVPSSFRLSPPFVRFNARATSVPFEDCHISPLLKTVSANLGGTSLLGFVPTITKRGFHAEIVRRETGN